MFITCSDEHYHYLFTSHMSIYFKMWAKVNWYFDLANAFIIPHSKLIKMKSSIVLPLLYVMTSGPYIFCVQSAGELWIRPTCGYDSLLLLILKIASMYSWIYALHTLSTEASNQKCLCVVGVGWGGVGAGGGGCQIFLQEHTLVLKTSNQKSTQ
jgi:hypothetical protein